MPALSFPSLPSSLPPTLSSSPHQDVQNLRKTTARERLWVGHGLWDAHGCSGSPEALEESPVSHTPKASRICVSLTPLYK